MKMENQRWFAAALARVRCKELRLHFNWRIYLETHMQIAQGPKTVREKTDPVV